MGSPASNSASSNVYDVDHAQKKPSTPEESRHISVVTESTTEEKQDVHALGPKATNEAGSTSQNPGRDLEKGLVSGANQEDGCAINTTEDVDAEEYPRKDEEEDQRDPNLVTWNGEDDPENPMNWPASTKWRNIALLSLTTLVTPLASSMFAPGVPQILKAFGTQNKLMATFVVSVYILGFAFGPLVFAPLSEMYGRVPVYHLCNVGFLIFLVACAVSNSMDMLVGFRFLAGVFGSAVLTLGAGTISDFMPPEERGGAMALWAMGPLLGPIIGPIAGGFLVEHKGWRWVFWLLAILAAAIAVTSPFILFETYGPVLLGRKTTRLRKETGNLRLRNALDQGLSHKERFALAIVRPAKMLFCSPIVAIMSLYTAIIYGTLYLLFTTITFVFEDIYGFSSSMVGLAYLGVGIGMMLGLPVAGKGTDIILQRRKAKGLQLKPEDRLDNRLVIPGACAMPIGLFLYGWTTKHHVQWMAPLIGTAFLGFGMIITTLCIMTYLVDAFTVHSASAMAANTLLRSLFGALLPLGGLSMYDTLGLGWGNSLVAFIATAMIPVPILFRKYGEKIRQSKWGNVTF
ncbi:major facilitator superfamily domain-containing protein [Phyllosticta citribraziliensis]|uniref:Major facilitator superfamily domain-containing protein n=1 Tax=Phyllosticta citribraziliensis TaxID=989973 RepID=A0ABR1M561_9PEZI